jgi:chromosome segregation protein
MFRLGGNLVFLKRLDVIGFKSFAERVAIEFFPGVTAVVGPNGSGKSNITDSIRWVLGEQSAKSLRGAKMEDIIFAGSDSRKAVNFAEVSLTLDNQDQFLPLDYNEVSVTRRVFRSGESEFFINKQSCRLKDIVDLFMDSGLGKEAFSIIGQGKIEQILNSKSEERRVIFEEAAGVLKYKTRRKKAESKLEETQENLNRVQDILFELEGQVEPLKIQASIAKDYLEQKKELEQFEVALTAYEITSLHTEWDTLKIEWEQHQREEEKLSSNLMTKEANEQKVGDRIRALDESISDLQDVLLSVSEDLEKVEGRKEVLKERKKNATQNKDQLLQTINESTKMLEKLMVEKEETETHHKLLKDELDGLKGLLNEKKQTLAIFSENIEEQIESLKSDYIDKLNQVATAKNEIQYIRQQNQQQSMRTSRLKGENQKYIEERNQLIKSKQQLEKDQTQIEKELEEVREAYQSIKKQLDLAKVEVQDYETKLQQARQFVNQARSRKELLEEMEEDYSGFFQGVKEVLKARKILTGVKGAVAELIRVPKKYEVALETALGGSMQHVVVESERDARESIQYLKIKQFGRATFLPLSVIKGKYFSSAQRNMVQDHEAFVNVASDLVEADPSYEVIVQNLLGQLIVANDLKGANELAKILQFRNRIVTLDGDIVNPGGSMTGGASAKKSNSLLSRKGELESLKLKLEEMELKTEKLEFNFEDRKRELLIVETKEEVLRETGERTKNKTLEIQASLREIERVEKNLNDRLSLYDMEKSDYDQETEKLKMREHHLSKVVSENQILLEDLDSNIVTLTAKKSDNQSSRDHLMEEVGELKASLAAKNQEWIASEKHLERTNEMLIENQKKNERVREDYKWLTEEMNGHHNGEEELSEIAEQKSLQKVRTTQLIALRRKERHELQQVLESEQAVIKELKRQHRSFVQLLKDEEVKLNRLDVDLENRLIHLQEEYLLSYEAAKEGFPLTGEPNEVKRKVKLIKLSIEELGTVNIGAIDEYERVFERYEFLRIQKEDLQDAKNTLSQVIDEMDDEMKRRFHETFKAIESHFEGVFQSLFGGGHASLKLSDPTNLLTTGVDIIAQPPGKKLQNLGLLSGGERALTAIALLFSILKVRPVPFCVLDEVEAALDEANVFRFSQYLKQFSRETQFIVITHRQGTMEGADVLYGVTMQESGVSKLVSVKLSDKDLIARK